MNITKEELDGFMKQLESIKATIEILQNEEIMNQIKESENLRKQGVKPIKIDV